MNKKDLQFFEELFRMIARKLDESFAEITLQFAKLNTKLDQILMTQADFDAKLATLKPAIDQVKTDFEAYKAAAQAQGVDLSAEGATLQMSLDALSSLHTEVSAGGTTGTSTPAASGTDSTAQTGSPSPTPATT